MPDEEIVSGSQTETTPAPERDAETEALYASFDIKPAAVKKEIEFPDLSKGEQPDEVESDPPAKETPTEPKKLTVKFNKEDVEVDVSDEKIPEYVQKSLALDKERERREKNDHLLKEAAKLLGLESLDESTIQRLNQVQQQQAQNEHDQLRTELRQQAEYLGYDADSMQSYLDNHPLVKQAEKAIQERDAVLAEKNAESFQKGVLSEWDELFKQHSDIERREVVFEGNKAFFSGEGAPDWLTQEMVQRLERGYSVKDAFELSHRDKITAQTKKAAEQKVIKQQHLGARSAVEGQAATQPDEVTLLPEQMALAAEFGVKLEGVRNQQKQLSRR